MQFENTSVKTVLFQSLCVYIVHKTTWSTKTGASIFSPLAHFLCSILVNECMCIYSSNFVTKSQTEKHTFVNSRIIVNVSHCPLLFIRLFSRTTKATSPLARPMYQIDLIMWMKFYSAILTFSPWFSLPLPPHHSAPISELGSVALSQGSTWQRCQQVF